MKGLVAAAILGFSAGAAAGQSAYSGLGAGSLPPELVARYAPPALDPAVSRRIQSMLDVRSPGLGAVSPDGKHLFFTWAITGSTQVWRVDGAGSFPIQMTGGEDRTGISDMTPDGKWLLLSRDIGGQENPGLYAQAVGGGPLKTIQKVEKVQTFLEFVSEDSRAVYFRANDRRPDSFAIYRYDLASGERSLVLDEPGLWQVADHRGSGDDLKILLAKATGSLWAEYYELRPAARKLTPLLGVGEKIEYAAAYAAQAGELLVQTNRFGDFRRMYRWKIGSGQSRKDFTPVSPELPMDVSGFSIDDARQHVYLSMNDGGYTRLRVMSASTFAPEELPLPKDADHVYPGTASHDGRYVTIGVETSRSPRVSYVWDWAAKTMTQWVTPNAPEVDTSTFVSARLMTYPARDGTPIPMFVRFPKGCAPEERSGADPCPVVVEFHGGPEGQAQPGFSPYAQIFVDDGFIYVEPNVRGSDGYGKKWLDSDNGARRLDVITDIDDCGKWIRQHWGSNGKAPAVGITGGSYGGYSTLVGMTMFAGTYDAGASVVGISNLATFLQNTSPYRRLLRISEYGDPEKDAEALKKLSPITYIDRVKSPLLLIQGLNDPRVPAGEAVQIQQALENKGIASRLILIPDEGHGSSKRGNRVIEIGNVLKFFEMHLKGGKSG